MSLTYSNTSVIDPIRTAADENWLEAYNASRADVAAPRTEGDFERLYAASVEENKKLNHLIEAARFSTPPPSSDSHKTLDTCARVRGRLGELAFHKLTRVERLEAVGVDVTTTDAYICKIFGSKFDPSLQRDLHRSDPKKYARIREAYRILHLQ